MSVKHGMSRTPTYKTWDKMISRCSDKEKKNYYGRGITVCEKWKTFSGFFEDMGVRPDGKTIDRIDNSLGYFKENCRWATRQEQAKNRRTNRKLTYDGETMVLSDWAKKIGLSENALRGRLNKGWGIIKSFTTPKIGNIERVCRGLNGQFTSKKATK